jgi:ABC-type bacteriocin/lantibiotic exporter with double-glycine peptidase domain
VLLVGARLVIDGDMTSGALLIFVLYLARMYKPMKDLSKMSDTMSKAAVSLERIREVLDTESQVQDHPNAQPAPAFAGRIVFDRVRFAYAADRPVLDGICLEIEPGQSVALVVRPAAGSPRSSDSSPASTT